MYIVYLIAVNNCSWLPFILCCNTKRKVAKLFLAFSETICYTGYNCSLFLKYMHTSYTYTWPHMISLLFVADMNFNLLYLDAPFFYSYMLLLDFTFASTDTLGIDSRRWDLFCMEMTIPLLFPSCYMGKCRKYVNSQGITTW